MVHPASSCAFSRVFSTRALDGFWVVATLVVNVGGVLVVSSHTGAGLPGPTDLALLLTGPMSLWWRRRFPTLVLAGCVAATWTYVFVATTPGPIYGPMIVALVSAVHQGPRPAAYAVVLGTLLTRLTALVIPGVEGPSLASTTALAAWLAFLLALGELLRHRQALRGARHQRLLATLDAQADQLRREAAEHRFALARELHDVIGHQLAVINIQAKAGLQLHAAGKTGATDALGAVQEASRQTLDDVQAFLDSLHEPDEHPTHAPSPSLSNLECLLTPARTAGLEVRVEVNGTPRRLPAPHDLAASRVVLECLTNVLRHAGLPRTWVCLEYAPHQLTVRIDNAPPTEHTAGGHASSGRGLEGLRERLAAQGGTLTAGPTADLGWSVVAVLPLPKEHS